MNEIVWAIDPHHANINIGSDGQKFYHNVKNSKRITEMRKIHTTPQRVMILADLVVKARIKTLRSASGSVSP